MVKTIRGRVVYFVPLPLIVRTFLGGIVAPYSDFVDKETD